MCGIAVAIDWPEAETIVERLIQGVLHRGDISDPIFSPRPNTAMATRRLRIVDAEHGDPAAILVRRGTCGFVQRRNLQPSRAASRAERSRRQVRNGIRHRSPRQCAAGLGLSGLGAPHRHVCLCRRRCRDRRIPRRARSVRRQAALCHAVRRRLPVLLGDAAAARHGRGGDVMLLPPGYALSRKNCARFKSPVYPRARCAGRGQCRDAGRAFSRRRCAPSAAGPAGRDAVFAAASTAR